MINVIKGLCDNNITVQEKQLFYKSWLYGTISGIAGTIYTLGLIKNNTSYKNIIIYKTIIFTCIDFYVQKLVFSKSSPLDSNTFIRFVTLSIIGNLLVYVYINQLSDSYYNQNAKTNKQKLLNFIIFGIIGSILQYFIYYPFTKEWVFCNKFNKKQFIIAIIVVVILYLIIKYVSNKKKNQNKKSI